MKDARTQHADLLTLPVVTVLVVIAIVVVALMAFGESTTAQCVGTAGGLLALASRLRGQMPVSEGR